MFLKEEVLPLPKILSQEEKFRMMTESPIPGLIGRLSVPTVISMLITSIYNMADTFFVGKISTSATAAVGVVFPVMAIIQALGFFCGHGSGQLHFAKARFQGQSFRRTAGLHRLFYGADSRFCRYDSGTCFS